MYITANTVITAASVLAAVVSFVTLFWKLFKWISHQKEQDQIFSEMQEQHKKDIADLKNDFNAQIKSLRDRHESDNSFIQEEQTLVVYGLLCCLKGLAEQGCDGPVSEAIDKLEKHINQKSSYCAITQLCYKTN